MSPERQVTEYIVHQFQPGVTADELDADYDLLANGIIDSLGLLRLVDWLDRTFDIAVGEADLAPSDFRTVGTICKFIKERSR
ncbi:acyl carrier protein [Allorhizocola rhizosphaerae]|uniref:acyl carrier protein n=1 Tax=Allorhizocola rhizosphaerae TaxID=1872709 RepID=UPI000E3C1583|nr:acyl carrier protein [Allorhizocola rhizosphaerae]